MNTVFLGLITLAVLVLTGSIIYIILELRKTISSLGVTVESFEKTAIPTVEQLQVTFKSVRKISDDVGVVSEEAKGLSGSVREMGKNVKYASEEVSRITADSLAQISDVRAGIKAGLGYLISNLLTKRQQDKKIGGINMEREDSGCKCSASAAILSFFIGGLIGAGVALLVAPKTGEEARKMIKDLAEETKEKVDSYIHDAKEKATTYVEKGKGFIEKEKNAVSRAVEAGKETYEKEKHS